MSAVAGKAAIYGEGTVVITRVFDAPRALVWQAWTDPKMLGAMVRPARLHQLRCRNSTSASAAPCASSCTGRTATTIR